MNGMDEDRELIGVNDGIAIVLNGGKKEMNSATIPIRWWLSKKVIEKDPQYILFFEQNEEGSERYGFYGRRYACKISDAVKFLQIFSSGYHRIMVLAIKSKNVVDGYLSTDGVEYRASLNWNNPQDNVSKADGIIAVTVAEFDVPQELFAKKSETKLSRLIWKWTNLWYKRIPKDECSYRKRKIVAFTIQPPIMAIWYLLKYCVAGGMYALYILLASFAIFFVGFRPRPIFREMWKAFTLNRYGDWSVMKYEKGDQDIPNQFRYECYRLWSISNDNKTAKYMPRITPFIATLITGAIIFLYNISIDVWLFIITIVVFIALCIYVGKASLYFRNLYFRKKTNHRHMKLLQKLEREQQKVVEQEAKEMLLKELARNWMMKNFDLSKKTDNKVHLDKLPIPFNLRDRVIQKFQVGFWTLKTKVCKPFER